MDWNFKIPTFLDHRLFLTMEWHLCICQHRLTSARLRQHCRLTSANKLQMYYMLSLTKVTVLPTVPWLSLEECLSLWQHAIFSFSMPFPDALLFSTEFMFLAVFQDICNWENIVKYLSLMIPLRVFSRHLRGVSLWYQGCNTSRNN